MRTGFRERSLELGAAAFPALGGIGVFSIVASLVPMSAAYQGKLFAVTLLGLVLAIALTTLWVIWIEKRMAAYARWPLLAASLGPPLLAVACLLFGLSLLPTLPKTTPWGPITVFSRIRELIPATLGGTLAFALIQCRSSKWRRVGAAVIWLVVAAAATQDWVLSRSFVDREFLADLWHWDDAALRWKLPALMGLAIAGAALGLLTRWQPAHRRLRFVPTAAYLAAVGAFMWPAGYAATWAKEDLGQLLAAYVNADGDLIVNARAAPPRALGTTLSAVLIRPHGQTGFRAVSTFPVLPGEFGPFFSTDLRCVDVNGAASLPARLLGAYVRRQLLEVASGKVLECSTERLQRPTAWFYRGRALGPGRSWFHTESDSLKQVITVWGVTTHGEPFADQRQGLQWGNQGGWFEGSTFHLFASDLHRTAQTGGHLRYVTWLVDIDLGQGRMSMRQSPPDGFGVVVGTSPSGRRFVAWRDDYEQGRAPCITYSVVETSGESRTLGAPCRHEAFIPVWREEGDPTLLPECRVVTALQEATLQDSSRAPGFPPNAHEMGGRIFIEQGSRYETKKIALLELTEDGSRAWPVAAAPVSVQWLPDSIVWCEQTPTGGRVIRFYPSEDRYDVLLDVP